MYRLTKDTTRHRVALQFSGHMDQEPQAFFAELTEAARSVQSETGWWDLLVDFSDTPVMPQDRAQNTERIFNWCLSNGVRKIAFVLNSSIQKMQVRRVTQASDTAQSFDNIIAARRWLMEGSPS